MCLMVRELGAELRSLRLARGLSMVEAARRAGISRVTLHRWETDQNVPPAEALDRLLQSLDTEPRVQVRLLAAVDLRQARIALAHTSLGAAVNVGMVLRAMRVRRGITQGAVARAVGATQAAVSKWEAGDATPSVETVHALGFAMGAMVEETLALASAQDIGAEAVPWDKEEARETIRLKYLPAPLVLQEVVSIGWEAEMWRRAARDPRWEPLLARVLAYRTNQFVLDGRFDEILPLAQRALRLATTVEGRVEAVPAVSSLGYLAEHRGEEPRAAAEAAGTWAERIPDSEMRAWMLRAHGMGLAKMGQVADGLDLVRRSLDMDAHYLYAHLDDDEAWRTRAVPMADAYMAAGMPERAAEKVSERDYEINPTLMAEIAHALGRPAEERYLQEARRHLIAEEIACAFAYSNWWSRRRVARVERVQSRLLRRSTSA